MSLPIVEILTPTNVGFYIATFNGRIIQTLPENCGAVGFIYDIVSHANPGDGYWFDETAYAYNSYTEGDYPAGEYPIAVAGLAMATKYYVRFGAFGPDGGAYSDEYIFYTLTDNPGLGWGQLLKNQVDPEKIEDAISRIVSQHNEDPESHLEVGEALQSHKSYEIIDHLARSIITDKLALQAVTNAETKVINRAYTAIVDAAGGGDYTDIQSAINFVHGIGFGNILIKAGTYVQTAILTLYSNIHLYGEDDDATIINFNNGNYYFQATGTFANPLTNIVISGCKITNGGANSKGAIHFSNVNDSQIIENNFVNNTKSTDKKFGDIYSEACSRLTIMRNRSSGSNSFLYGYGYYCYIEYNYLSNLVGDLTIGSTSAGLSHSFITQNYMYGCPNPISLGTNSGDTTIINNNIQRWTGTAISVNGGNGLIMGNYLDGVNIGTAGIVITSSNIYVRIIANLCYRINGVGITLTSSNWGNLIEGNNCVSNVGTGLMMTNCSWNTINGNQFIASSGGYGINISNSACSKNIVTSNQVWGNNLGQINDIGTGTIKANNNESA